MKRIAVPEELGKAAVFLAVDATATTGETLNVDAGQTAIGRKSKAAYDAVAAFYDPHWGRDFLDGALTMYAQWLAPRLPASGARMLDICCGSGEFAQWIARNHRVTGVDLSGAMLAIASNKVPQACFEHKDMRTFRLAVRDSTPLSAFTTASIRR